MRTIFRIPAAFRLALLSTGLGLWACENPLKETPDSFLAASSFFRNTQDAEAAMAGVYYSFQDINWGMWDVTTHQLTAPIDAPYIAMDNYSYDAQSTTVESMWRNLYASINRANGVLDRLPGIQSIEKKTADRLLGEARFLRALYYFYLVRSFGHVPLLTTETTDLKSIYVKASPVDQVYELIIADLKMAESLLPPSSGYNAVNKGRASRGAAQTLLGKVYLTRKAWADAKAVLTSVVNSREYGLFDDFDDNFKEATENGIEHIFSMQFSDVPGAVQAQIADYFAPRFSGLGDRNGGWGSFVSEKKFYENFPKNDYRAKVTFLADTVGSDGKTLAYPGKGLAYPHVRKWMIKEKGNNGRGLNFTVLRYADVLLMLAEAENELNGPTEGAYQAFNQLRTRARRKAAAPANLQPGSLTKDEFRETVFREREIELCFENHSWFDLKRSGKLLDVMGKQEKTSITAKNELFPIPQLELDNNPSLTQNPGW